MKKLILFTTVLLLLTGCSSRKKIERELNTGNYDQAINNALKKLESNKDKKSKSDYILLLKDAFNKVVERDINKVNFLKKDGNPANYVSLYQSYVNLNMRQERIKPILPLYINNKEVKLNFRNYTEDIIASKENASSYLYDNAKTLLNSTNKFDYRKAFEDFDYIDQINPNYKDVRQLIDLAHTKGRDFVLVEMVNDTQQVIPERLEDDLLNFSTFGLNDLWTEYHNTKDGKVSYDFAMGVNLRDINISPEQVKERQIIKEKQVVDGWQYLLDEHDEFVKDSLGNKIKVDKFKTVRCEYYEFKQLKLAQVSGNVEYKDLKTNQLIDAFPISSEFIFEHIYATSRGDRRALDDNLIGFLNNRVVPFPSNEQMIYDTGEDLKLQLKEIITGHNFR